MQFFWAGKFPFAFALSGATVLQFETLSASDPPQAERLET